MTGKVLLARQPDWRTRQRLESAATSPPAWKRREAVEFDEPESDHGGSDSGWTVGYLDVLLLLVTLFAALLAATYLQISQLRAAQVAEAEPLAVFAPATPQSPSAARTPDLAPRDAENQLVSASDPTAELESEPARAESQPSSVAKAEGPEPHTRTEPKADSAAADPGAPAPIASGSSVAATLDITMDIPGIDPEPAPTVPPQFLALMDLVATHADRQDLELLLDQHQLRLELGDGILFDSGTADLGAVGRALIEELVTALDDDRLKISVEGHTDDVPINTPRFPSNWELSSIRATTVARELIAHGIPQHRIRVTGFADTRPRAPNDSAANRALNRRVSLVLEVSEEILAGAY